MLHRRVGNAPAVAACLLALCVALSAATLLFGLFSWISIKKWRQFHNYVYLKLITVSTVFIVAYYYVRTSCYYPSNFVVFVYKSNYELELFLAIAFNVMLHWQFVATITFYMDIVKVINIDVLWRYKIANFFGWLLPVLEVIIDFILQRHHVDFLPYIVVIISVVNAVLYFSIILILVRIARGGIRGGVEVFQDVLGATFAFVTCGVPTVVPMLLKFSKSGTTILPLSEEDIALIYSLNTIVVTVYFVKMKSHKELWKEYRERNSSSRSDISLDATLVG